MRHERQASKQWFTRTFCEKNNIMMMKKSRKTWDMEKLWDFLTFWLKNRILNAFWLYKNESAIWKLNVKRREKKQKKNRQKKSLKFISGASCFKQLSLCFSKHLSNEWYSNLYMSGMWSGVESRRMIRAFIESIVEWDLEIRLIL